METPSLASKSALVRSQLARLFEAHDSKLVVNQEAVLTLSLVVSPQSVLAALSYLQDGQCEICTYNCDKVVVVRSECAALVDTDRWFCCCTEKARLDLAGEPDGWCSHLIGGELVKLHKDMFIRQGMVAERPLTNLEDWLDLHNDVFTKIRDFAP